MTAVASAPEPCALGLFFGCVAPFNGFAKNCNGAPQRDRVSVASQLAFFRSTRLSHLKPKTLPLKKSR